MSPIYGHSIDAIESAGGQRPPLQSYILFNNLKKYPILPVKYSSTTHDSSTFQKYIKVNQPLGNYPEVDFLPKKCFLSFLDFSVYNAK